MAMSKSGLVRRRSTEDELLVLRRQFLELDSTRQAVAALRGCLVVASTLYESRLRARERADKATLLSFRILSFIAQMKPDELARDIPKLNRMCRHALGLSRSVPLHRICDIVLGITDSTTEYVAASLFSSQDGYLNTLISTAVLEETLTDRVGLPTQGSAVDFLSLLPMSTALIGGTEWSFWKGFFQQLSDGEFSQWDLIKEIADIPDSEWEAGQKNIANLIIEIESRYLSEKIVQAETVEFDLITSNFSTVPIPIENTSLLAATLSQVSDALDDTLTNPSNGLSERSREAKVLRRTVDRYGNDPQRIEMDLVGVHASITRQLLSEDLPPSEENLALQAALEEGAHAVRATHPEVAANRRILSRQRLRSLTAEQKTEISEAQSVLSAISDTKLGEDWAHDIPSLINDSIGAIPTNAPALPGADSATRIFSRVSKITLILRQSNEVLEAVGRRTGLSKGDLLSLFVSIVGIGIGLLV